MRSYEANWHKSSYSGTSSNCVEVAGLAKSTAVRDTKHRDLGMLIFPSAEWQAFLTPTQNNMR